MSLRYAIVVTQEMVDALKRVSKQTRIPVSTLIRDAVLDMLREHGEAIEVEIAPGGNRRKAADNETEN